MNKLIIIGNLTRKPELRTTAQNVNVCDFTVAVNRKQKKDANSQPEADFFRVSAWRQLADICAKYLDKGSKVCVTGSVGGRTYTGTDGKTYFNLEVNADDVEFLSSKGDSSSVTATAQAAPAAASAPAQTFAPVETDELPF